MQPTRIPRRCVLNEHCGFYLTWIEPTLSLSLVVLIFCSIIICRNLIFFSSYLTFGVSIRISTVSRLKFVPTAIVWSGKSLEPLCPAIDPEFPFCWIVYKLNKGQVHSRSYKFFEYITPAGELQLFPLFSSFFVPLFLYVRSRLHSRFSTTQEAVDEKETVRRRKEEIRDQEEKKSPVTFSAYTV